LFVSGLSFGQCPSGNIELNSQQEVDDFAIIYPNCTEINANLRVELPLDATNLGGLSPIISVAGELDLRAGSYENLIGLDNLTSVGGDFLIQVTNVRSLEGLENMESVGGLFF